MNEVAFVAFLTFFVNKVACVAFSVLCERNCLCGVLGFFVNQVACVAF